MSIAIIGMEARIVCAEHDAAATRDTSVVSRQRYPESEEVADTVRTLRDKLERYRHRRARQAGWVERFVPTGLTPVDAALPRGGLPCGAITEILSENPGVGAMSLAMRLAAQCLGLEQPGVGRALPAAVNSPHGQAAFSCLGTSSSERERDCPPLRNSSTACPCHPAAKQSVPQTLGTIVYPSQTYPALALGARIRADGKHDQAPEHSLKSRSRPPLPSPLVKGRDPVPTPLVEGRTPLSSPLVKGGKRDHRGIVLVDTFGDFYPPAARQHGLPLDRLIVLHAGNARDAFWAVDQALRCPAVAAVIAPLTHLDERGSRRLQLAAESSGCLGLTLRPARQRHKSFAAVQMLIEGVNDEVRVNTLGQAPSSLPGHEQVYESCLCRITLLTVREGTPAEPLWVDLHHETGACLVHPVPVDRSAAKTG